MSVCNSACIKTTADSKENYSSIFFLNVSDNLIEYNIFDTDNSIVDSNNFKEDKNNTYQIPPQLSSIKLQ